MILTRFSLFGSFWPNILTRIGIKIIKHFIYDLVFFYHYPKKKQNFKQSKFIFFPSHYGDSKLKKRRKYCFQTNFRDFVFETKSLEYQILNFLQIFLNSRSLQLKTIFFTNGQFKKKPNSKIKNQSKLLNKFHFNFAIIFELQYF